MSVLTAPFTTVAKCLLSNKFFEGTLMFRVKDLAFTSYSFSFLLFQLWHIKVVWMFNYSVKHLKTNKNKPK